MDDKAEYRVAWADKIVYMCKKHFEQLSAIGEAMGYPTQGEKCGEGYTCENCKKEAKKSVMI